MAAIVVDVGDIEALLYAAGAADNAQPSVKRALAKDAQFEQVAPRLRDVIARVGNAWRDGNRREQFPERFKAPTAFDLARIRDLGKRGARGMFGAVEHLIGPVDRDLITNGFVELGVYAEECVWANSGHQRFQHAERRVRLTARGSHALIEADERERLAALEHAVDVANPPMDDERSLV